MTDRVYPSSKPATNGVANGATTTVAAANPAVVKPQPLRPPYRPQPQYHHHRHRRSNRSLCCCCFWSILILLILSLLAAIAGTALYVLYRPHRPEFTVTALKIGKLNLTDAPDNASSHLVSLFNLTLAAKNPNNHLKFDYESFELKLTLSSNDDVSIANGSIQAFSSDTKNFMSVKSVLIGSYSLDPDAGKAVRSVLKRKSGVPMKLEMDTKVKVTVGGKLKSKKVGIRVTCQQIRGVAPKGKSPSVASVADSHCKVDLRIKIWRWTF